MEHFTNPPLYDRGPDPKTGREVFQLGGPLVFRLPIRRPGVLSYDARKLAEVPSGASGAVAVKVPEGFRTDLASIPRPLWWLFPPFGDYLKPSILHDYLCVSPGCPRALADALFRVAMKLEGVRWYKRFPIYCGARLWAWLTLQL
jgi:hypothetical protein